MTADRLPGHDDDADDLALINAVMAMPFDDCTRWRCKRTRLTRWGMAMSEGQSAESEAPEVMVWHDEADRLAVWGCLDPTDACMCRDCVLSPGGAA